MSNSCVYIADQTRGWLPAHVVSHENGDEAIVKVFDVAGNQVLDAQRSVSLKAYPNGDLPLQNVDAAGQLITMADMVDLPSLHEPAILYNLRARHLDKKPYTRVGDLIIAVNPFQWLEGLYNEACRSRYIQDLIFMSPNTNSVDARAQLPPHVYETSALAYRGLAVDGKHQSILVSGESGAGKTETVKIVMGHLASVHAPREALDDTQHQMHHHLVVQRTLDAQPVLEAFGNSKTVRNDNSSRFGKFIQMQFDVEDANIANMSGRAVPNCVLAGSKCETYLLEKSRVVGHEQDERTYHIFYQLLAAPSNIQEEFGCKGLVGKQADDFRYVGACEADLQIEGKTDAQRFEKTLKALKLLDICGNKLKTLFSAVTVVMQLGNLVIEQDPDDSEKAAISSTDELHALAELMGIDDVDAVSKALLYRTVVAGKGESYTVPLKATDARDGCDAFAKEIYQQVFDWLVREINAVTCAEVNYDDASDVETYGLIGLLDIFGFESFVVNRFEQLCINYTNEKLQQKYTKDIFRSVQEEYAHEGIELGELTFEDNAEVLRLIEGKIGIISVLNEECVRPKGNDTAFVSKVKSVNKEVPYLISENLHKPIEFAIQHYAGQVKYDATNFVQKNTDALPKDLIDCACLSSNELINVELKAAADAKVVSAGGRRGAQTLTVATKFKSQLTKLMHDITKTKTRYIRCIKPNADKAPVKIDMSSSAEQLRCAGVVAAVTISRVAFPNRLMHETALERFGCLSHVDLEQVAEEKKQETDVDETGYRDAVDHLLTNLLKSLEVTKEDGAVTRAFEVGKSRVYFRTGALEKLEAMRLVALGSFAVSIERMARGFIARSKYWKLKDAAIVSQANARCVVAQKSYLRAKNASIIVECWARCVFAKRALVRLQRQKAAVQIQSRWKSVIAVVMFTKCKNAAVVMQKTARGAIQRPKYRRALKDAEEEARVNSKLAALQKKLKQAEMKAIQADKQRIAAEKRAAGVASGELPPTAAVAEPATVDSDYDEEEKKSEEGDPDQQKTLIDESNEMLEYFRDESFKLKGANYLLRTDLADLKEEHQRLQMHNESMEASCNAMKQNMNRMSDKNTRLATQVSEQKDLIGRLKHELKSEKTKSAAELQRKKEELLGRDKSHDGEVTRLKRELERMRKIIAKTPAPASDPHGRATFQNASKGGGPVLGYRKEPESPDNNMSRSSSMAEMSPNEEGQWGHDGYYAQQKRAQKCQEEEWVEVKKKPRSSKNSMQNGSKKTPTGRRNRTPYSTPKRTPHSTPKKTPKRRSSLEAAASSGRKGSASHQKKNKQGNSSRGTSPVPPRSPPNLKEVRRSDSSLTLAAIAGRDKK